MSEFAVDPAIQKLAHRLADWPLCRVFLYNDSRYPWGLLVPRRPGAIEMCDLVPEDQAKLMAEIVKLSNLIRTLPGVEKLNVGALGNKVPQLHVHLIGRRKGDPAWPGPVWGHSDPVPWPSPADAPLSLAIAEL
ncbi:MAG TPA: HIT domain-containing protein [Rhizomicrobium sp.]|nr:HIT domain-containing protein [Rhizomicrobium sp.]